MPVSSLSYRTISNAKAAIVVTWVTPLVCVLPAWWAHNLHSYQTRRDLPISTKHNIHFNFSSYSYAYPSIRFNHVIISSPLMTQGGQPCKQQNSAQGGPPCASYLLRRAVRPPTSKIVRRADRPVHHFCYAGRSALQPAK